VDKKSYLNQFQKFQLGQLVTEQAHPLTQGLSDLAKQDLVGAIQLLQKVDLLALESFATQVHKLTGLVSDVQNCLKNGGRIFIGGCGATGRLALLLESLWQEQFGTDQVCAFMAGGDVALVHSLEGFEDYPEHGRRHLKSLGFKDTDLFIGVTEGGETPYVIGATRAAAEISKQSTYFIFCNPPKLLMGVERSRQVLESHNIKKVDLSVGPMALSGSTRMQASTVLQLAVGFALLIKDQDPLSFVNEVIQLYRSLDLSGLSQLIQKEHWIYGQGEYVMYMPRTMALTVFTDTTERSPTFSLPPFESSLGTDKVSLCYVLLPQAEDSVQAWQQLLKRSPRPLNWSDVGYHTSESYLQSFDFSKHALEQRESRLNDQRQYLFEVQERNRMLQLSLGGTEWEALITDARPLVRNTCLKMILNLHSTLLMGLMGRYKSNIMTWVRPSNGKLVDRAARYVALLLAEKSIAVDYLDIVNRIFDFKQKSGGGLATRGLVDLVAESFINQRENYEP
jgi:N-acetylmuramic acid 6-phosphate etherase